MSDTLVNKQNDDESIHEKPLMDNVDENDNEHEDSDDDIVKREVDFEFLSENGMSAATLALLQQHLNSNNAEDTDTTSANKYEENSIDLRENVEKFDDSNTKFKRKDYWDDRFQKEEEYDWLAKFSDIYSTLQPYIKPSDKILVLGCGNSTFSEDLYDAGYHNIVNIDFSDTVIDNMERKYKLSRPSMEWICMDMTDLQFPLHSFDVVIDKAAMDALMVDEGDVWYPNQSVIDIVDKMCLSIRKVLKSHTGVYIQVSFAQPHFRTKYLMGSRIGETDNNKYSAIHGYSTRYEWTLLPHMVIEREAGCLNCFAFVMKVGT